MMIDITNIRLDEVSQIMSKMEKLGMTSRIERKDNRFVLVVQEMKKREEKKIYTLFNW